MSGRVHYDVSESITKEGNIAIDVFPPIPIALITPLYAKLNRMFEIAARDTPIADLIHPVNIDDEVRGPGSRIVVKNFNRESVIISLKTRLGFELNQKPESIDPATALREELGETPAIEIVNVNRYYL